MILAFYAWAWREGHISGDTLLELRAIRPPNGPMLAPNRSRTVLASCGSCGSISAGRGTRQDVGLRDGGIAGRRTRNGHPLAERLGLASFADLTDHEAVRAAMRQDDVNDHTQFNG
jgi:hypothetical protein